MSVFGGKRKANLDDTVNVPRATPRRHARSASLPKWGRRTLKHQMGESPTVHRLWSRGGLAHRANVRGLPTDVKDPLNPPRVPNGAVGRENRQWQLKTHTASLMQESQM